MYSLCEKERKPLPDVCPGEAEGLVLIEDCIVAPDVPVVATLDVANNTVLLVVVDVEAGSDGQALCDGHHAERGLDICLFHN